MPFHRLHLLGEERLAIAKMPTATLPTMAWPLIGVVLSAPHRRISRNLAAALLWPNNDEASARHCLASTVWRLKRHLGPLSILCSDRDTISITAATPMWIDVLAFETRAERILSDPSCLEESCRRIKLERALEFYRGDFLAQFDIETIAIERERLRALYLDASFELAHAAARHDEWRTTQKMCRNICLLEPLREDAQRLLMESLVACGNRASAVQHYRAFERLLDQELAVRPMRETRELAERIARKTPTGGVAPQFSAAQRETIRLVRQQILESLSLLDRALAE